MWFSPFLCYIAPLRPIYSPQHLLFSDTLSLRSVRIVSDQVSHPYKTTGKLIVPCILIFKFLDGKLEDRRVCTEW
jgi:hypothetical protein